MPMSLNDPELPEQTFHCGHCGRPVDETGLVHYDDSGNEIEVTHFGAMAVADQWPTEDYQPSAGTPPANAGVIAVALPKRGF